MKGGADVIPPPADQPSSVHQLFLEDDDIQHTGNEMSHNRVCVNYPISASKLVQLYASASVSDFLMSVPNDKLDDEN